MSVACNVLLCFALFVFDFRNAQNSAPPFRKRTHQLTDYMVFDKKESCSPGLSLSVPLVLYWCTIVVPGAVSSTHSVVAVVYTI